MMTHSWKLPFWVCSGYCAALCLALSIHKPLEPQHQEDEESEEPASSTGEEDDNTTWRERWCNLLRDGKALGVLALSAAATGSCDALLVVYGIWLKEEHNFTLG